MEFFMNNTDISAVLEKRMALMLLRQFRLANRVLCA
jgi:hypothetical protein